MAIEPEIDPARVELGRFYPQSPERVWRVLTDPARLDQWLMAATGFEGACVGCHFLLSVPTDPPNEIACAVLAATPGKAMTWSWVDMRAPEQCRWTLDWTVQPQGRGTRLLLTHSGFDIEDKRQKMARNALERGWKTVLSKFDEVLSHC